VSDTARPILILTASAGGGHVSAARALADRLGQARPDLPIELVDVLAWSNPIFRALYAGGYHTLERWAPDALGWIYDAADHVEQPGGWRAAFQRLNCAPLLRDLRRRRPQLIINTHFLPAELIAQERRLGRLDCPQVTVLTDFEVHRLWVQPPTERYFIACGLAHQHLRAAGVSSERISITGIPVRADFRRCTPRADLRRRLAIPPDRPLVLLLCGGLSDRLCSTLLNELMRLPDYVHLVAITGRNRAAFGRLRRQVERALPGEDAAARSPAESSPRVRVLGFAHNIADWMQAADLAVTKPGGLTSAEALATGLPLLLVAPIPGQEARNSDVLLEAGAAVKVNHPRVLAARVRELLGDAARQANMSDAARRIGPADAARRIVDEALAFLPDAARPRPGGAPAPSPVR
jgi:processive 1,2-diacylglycerol beta-glucosyltransferase